MYALSLRRTMVAVSGLGLALAAAAAAQYPPSAGSGQLSRSLLKRCQCTQFSGGGFVPGERVTVTDDGAVVATATAGARGDFSVKVCFDERDAEGRHELRATGASHRVTAAVEVRGDTCFRPGDEVHGRDFGRIPRTGSGLVGPGLLTGFGAVATGSAAVYAARRRRSPRVAGAPS